MICNFLEVQGTPENDWTVFSPSSIEGTTLYHEASSSATWSTFMDVVSLAEKDEVQKACLTSWMRCIVEIPSRQFLLAMREEL